MGSIDFDTGHPYAFISYKSENIETINKDIEVLHGKHNVNLWYDDDLTGGLNWLEEVKPILVHKNCRLVIFYASPEAICSTNVQREINLARNAAWNKPMILINFYEKKQFSEILHDVIQTDEFENKNKNKSNFNISGAIDLISDHLSGNITSIWTGDPAYYDKVLKSIERQAKAIIKISGATALPAMSPAKPEQVEVPDETTQAPVQREKPAKRSGNIGVTNERWEEIYNQFWNYARTKGIKDSDPVRLKYGFIRCCTENLERVYGLLDDPSQSPNKIKNVATYCFGFADKGKGSGVVNLNISVPKSFDLAKKAEVLDTLFDYTAIRKKEFGADGNIWSQFVNAKKNLYAANYTIENISEETIRKLVDGILEFDKNFDKK